MTKELEQIKKLYFEINKEFLVAPPQNTPETRWDIIQSLLLPLRKVLYSVRVICDEGNNPPDVMDDNMLIARVDWKNNKFAQDTKYVNLTFGDVEIVWN